MDGERKRADPGPKYPGIGNRSHHMATWVPALAPQALGRDDRSKRRAQAYCASPAIAASCVRSHWTQDDRHTRRSADRGAAPRDRNVMQVASLRFCPAVFTHARELLFDGNTV